MNFDHTREESDLVRKITLRYEAIRRSLDIHEPLDRLELHMDLFATHANGCPLDFQKLLDAPPLTLIHDIAGIRQHLDRETGKLRDCFLPRCALPSDAELDGQIRAAHDAEARFGC